jgi:hypothetical protein
LIIFNTKEEDLLHINELQENIENITNKEYELLDLKIEPFENVTYFLPRGKDGNLIPFIFLKTIKHSLMI